MNVQTIDQLRETRRAEKGSVIVLAAEGGALSDAAKACDPGERAAARFRGRRVHGQVGQRGRRAGAAGRRRSTA